MKEINLRIHDNKLRAKDKFLPQLKREIKDLAFEPGEINILKGRIIIQNNEKKLSIEKLKEDNKIIKMRKLEKENELNIVESQTDEILNKLNEINENINKEIEIKESEMIDFNEKREILQKKIINVLADIDTTKSENQKAQEKYNDVSKRGKNRE